MSIVLDRPVSSCVSVHRVRDGLGDSVRSLAQWIVVQMGEASCARLVSVSKKFADDREPHSARCTNARERMAEIMYAETVEIGAPRYRAPWAPQVRT